MTGRWALPPAAGERVERYLFMAVTSMVFSYLAIRAVLVPFAQDEGASFWLYVYSGEFMPFHSRPDAGNHFFSTLLGIIGYTVGGPAMIFLRWGSLMGFLLYASGVWKLTRSLSNACARWCAILALLLCPYLMDYFSMFRGYGPAMAFWLWALLGLFRFISTGTMYPMALMSVAMFLGVFTDLSLLPLWPLFLLLSALTFLSKRGPGGGGMSLTAFFSLAAVQLAAIAYAAVVAMDLSDRGLLYHGSSDGFYRVTVGSLVNAVFWTPEHRLVQVVTAFVVLAIAVAFIRAIRTRSWKHPLMISAIVLVGDILSRQAMHYLLGTNYPQDRAALHLVPLCILLFALAVDNMVDHGRGWAAMALVLLALPLHFLSTLNFGRILNDTTAAIPTRFIGEVERLRAEAGRPLMLAGNGQFPGCWAYNGLLQGVGGTPMRPDMNRDDPDDVRVLYNWQLPEYGEGFHVVDSGDVCGVALLFRDRLPVLEAYADTTIAGRVCTDEFLNLRLPADSAKSGTYVRMTGGFERPDNAWDLRLVVEAWVSSGPGTRSEPVYLQQLPRIDGTCGMDVLRWLPVVPGSERRLLIYNPQRLPYRLNTLRVRLYHERPVVAG